MPQKLLRVNSPPVPSSSSRERRIPCCTVTLQQGIRLSRELDEGTGGLFTRNNFCGMLHRMRGLDQVRRYDTFANHDLRPHFPKPPRHHGISRSTSLLRKRSSRPLAINILPPPRRCNMLAHIVNLGAGRKGAAEWG